MAKRQGNVTVSYTSAAHATLEQIWHWNSSTYGPDHAEQYISFLRIEADKLGTNIFLGKVVEGQPKYRYLTIRRTRKGHGYVAVYEIIEDCVIVLDFFHTARDWPTLLKNRDSSI